MIKFILNGRKKLLKTISELVPCTVLTSVKARIGIKPKTIVHENHWYWGTSYTTTTSDGLAVHNMGIEKETPDECFFGSIIVHKSVRGCGYGKMLHNIGEKRAKELGLKLIELVTDKNSWMQHWYERMGYKIIKSDDNTVTMRKYL